MENKLSIWTWKNETWISSFVVSFKNVPTRYPIICVPANNADLYMSKYIHPWDGLMRRSRESFVGVLEQLERA